VGPGDDAGVYLVNEHIALVETVDIITPLVDDPFLFGAISAANSLSDIYAMAGKPITALAILGYNPCDFDREIIKGILRGCLSKLQEAGVNLIGGHTVEDPEVKFGLSVTGIVEPEKILRKDGAMPGDLLCLTKPLGTGIAVTALKAGRLSQEHYEEVLRWMLLLNEKARDVALMVKARSCTDITGFGLIGHCLNMIGGRKVDFYLDFKKIPVMPFIMDLVRSGFVPKGAYENLNFFKKSITASLDEDHLLVLSDPQTSGGLLFSMPPEGIFLLQKAGIFFSIIGEVREGSGKVYIE
jgi:selenide,water dikinase